MKETMRMRCTRREALLAAMLPVVGLLMLNHLYMARLLAVHPLWYWAADVLQFVLVPAAVAWWLLRPAGVGLGDLGLAGRTGPREPAAHRPGWLLGAALLVAFTWPVFRLAGHGVMEYGDPSALAVAAPDGTVARVLLAIYMSATAALVEEVAFRALPWLYLREVAVPRWRGAVYVAASALLFAACHTEQGVAGVVSAGWFGVVAAGLYLGTRSLWPLVAGHFLIDLAIFGPW